MACVLIGAGSLWIGVFCTNSMIISCALVWPRIGGRVTHSGLEMGGKVEMVTYCLYF